MRFLCGRNVLEIIGGEIVEFHFELWIETVVGGSERSGQLLGSARAEDHGRDRRVRQDPSHGKRRQGFTGVADDRLQLANRIELPLIPIASFIARAERAEFR
jgi:hypothetical protein